MLSPKAVLIAAALLAAAGFAACGGAHYNGRATGYYSHGAYCDVNHYRRHRTYRRGCNYCSHYYGYHARGRRY